MDIDSSHTPNWLYDYGFDVPVAGADLPVVSSGGFNWVSPTFHGSSDTRLKSESCASGSKACREKLRRDRLNERFLELSSILEPGKLPKMDKTAILSDAVRMLTELRTEAQKLKETNDELLEKIKELKAEKNELRDEKNRLKMDKEKLEQRVKGMNAQPTYLSHPSAAFSAQGQTASHKLIPFVGYPGIGMWQFLPPAAVDTSRDHLLRPPVA
ncbi:transcription factor ILR3-like isoform X2 [Prosopis cineraria]|uniref:transcription factor ILR3-like isoform X2 n=1 Tax=Prosopis cineraria TaxID=364024 RepID=UPI002410B0EA|nr:transcription factor ILR3-like isoform X2 [Prosopis cineraria]XP_054814267.1 transcription factor ILR3-like isoform X2 [Prosopis cineraria]